MGCIHQASSIPDTTTHMSSRWYITITSTALQKSECEGLLPEQWIHLLIEVLDLDFTIFSSDLVILKKYNRRQKHGVFMQHFIKT